MFSLEYKNISQALRTMRYTGSARAEITSGVLMGSLVILAVRDGEMVSSIIVMPDGVQLQNEQQVRKVLEQAGILEWRLLEALRFKDGQTKKALKPMFPKGPQPTPEISDTTGPLLDPTSRPNVYYLSATSFPMRRFVDASWVRTWPYIYRQVYNLANGQYSEQDIARLLRFPPSALLRVFSDLEKMEVLQRGM